MENCLKFIYEVFDRESETVLKSFRPNLEEYNSSLEKLQESLAPELGYAFLMQPLDELQDSEYYARYLGVTSLPNRRLYRLNRHVVDGIDYYLVFTCGHGLESSTGISVLWIIKQVDGKFKIVARYRHPFGSSQEAWRFVGGDQRYDLRSFGIPVEVYRMPDPNIEDETALLFEHETGLFF